MKPDSFLLLRPESKPAIYGCKDTNPPYRYSRKIRHPHFTPPATDRKPLNEIMAVENFAPPWEY